MFNFLILCYFKLLLSNIIRNGTFGFRKIEGLKNESIFKINEQFQILLYTNGRELFKNRKLNSQ